MATQVDRKPWKEILTDNAVTEPMREFGLYHFIKLAESQKNLMREAWDIGSIENYYQIFFRGFTTCNMLRCVIILLSIIKKRSLSYEVSEMLNNNNGPFNILLWRIGLYGLAQRTLKWLHSLILFLVWEMLVI